MNVVQEHLIFPWENPLVTVQLSQSQWPESRMELLNMPEQLLDSVYQNIRIVTDDCFDRAVFLRTASLCLDFFETKVIKKIKAAYFDAVKLERPTIDIRTKLDENKVDILFGGFYGYAEAFFLSEFDLALRDIRIKVKDLTFFDPLSEASDYDVIFYSQLTKCSKKITSERQELLRFSRIHETLFYAVIKNLCENIPILVESNHRFLKLNEDHALQSAIKLQTGHGNLDNYTAYSFNLGNRLAKDLCEIFESARYCYPSINGLYDYLAVFFEKIEDDELWD